MARTPTVTIRVSQPTFEKLAELQTYFADLDRPNADVRRELNSEFNTDQISLGFVVAKCADELLDHIKRNRSKRKKGN